MLDQHIADTIRTVVREQIPKSSYLLFIFGSRANGEAKDFSDIDKRSHSGCTNNVTITRFGAITLYVYD